MKITKKITILLSAVLLCSCSGEMTEQAENDVTDIMETDVSETAVHALDHTHRDGILANNAVYDEFSDMILEKTGLEITDENISFTYKYNEDSRYPHIFTVNRKPDGMNFILEFGTYTENDVMHIGERNSATLYYGERDEDERLMTLEYETPSVFRDRLTDVLKAQFGDDIQLLVVGIIQSDTSLGIPIMAGTEFYYVDTEILRENNRENYRIAEYEKVDLNTVTPYEFFIKYNTFGLKPLEFCEYNSAFAEKLNSALTERFGQEFSFDNYNYMVSEFLPQTYIRLRDEKTNTILELYDQKLRKYFDPTEITEDTSWDDLEWIIGAPSLRADYSEAGNLFLPIINYMNALTDYIHEPYAIGDSLDNNNILYLCAQLCSGMDPDAPVYADFSRERDNGGMVIKIAKSEAEYLAKCLFGDNVDLTAYHDTFSGSFDKYDETTDTYTFGTGRDYWNGDNVSIDYDSIVIAEDENTVTVEISLGHSPAMGDPADPDSFRDYVYTFEKIESRGIGYLRVISITEPTE